MIASPPSQLLSPFQWRLLRANSLSMVMDLRQEVLTSLPLADLYAREADELAFVNRHLGSAGETLGVFDGSTLIAYAMLGLPDATATGNLTELLPIGGNDLAHSAIIASCMVRPKYRGKGLQRALISARLERARAHERTQCVAAVSLHNHASRHNLMQEGMRIAWVGELSGLRRQLLAIPLSHPWTFAKQPTYTVDALDFETQCRLTAQGLFGVLAHTGHGSHAIIFAARNS
jgi:GNAT superfamily N-acetyltransferase